MMDWNATDLALVLLMWALMMAAMMLPSILPVVLYVTRFGGSVPAVGFLAGYFLAWAAFSIAATLVQWALLEAALVSPMMQSASVPLSAAVLAGAGLYQFTPLKHTCLVHCRSPWGAVLSSSGATAALRDGLRYGAFCVGCCWVLMAVLFVVGVTNLLWMVIVSVYVVAEKWAPRAEWFSRAVGVLLCIAAVAKLGFEWR
jgi:predicted metal-binding membrane protein